MAYNANLLAGEINHLFEEKWHHQYGQSLPSETRADRLIMFEAVAEGVINHLSARASSSVILESDSHQHGAFVNVTGNPTVSVAQDTHAHNVSITKS